MVMIYTNFVALHCLMLHAKCQNHRLYGSKEDFFKFFAIDSYCSDLGHVTWTIYIVYKLLYPLPKDAAHEVWL